MDVVEFLGAVIVEAENMPKSVSSCLCLAGERLQYACTVIFALSTCTSSSRMTIVVAKQKYCKGLYEDFGHCYLHVGVKIA